MVKEDKDQPVLMSVKLSNHGAKHSDVFEVSSKGKDCDSKLSSRLLMSTAPPSYVSMTFGGKNVFSFCRSNNGTSRDKMFFSYNQMVLTNLGCLESQLFVDLLENTGTRKGYTLSLKHPTI